MFSGRGASFAIGEDLERVVAHMQSIQKPHESVRLGIRMKIGRRDLIVQLDDNLFQGNASWDVNADERVSSGSPCPAGLTRP